MLEMVLEPEEHLLQEAAESGDLAAVQMYLAKFPQLLDTQARYAFRGALIYKHTNVVQYLATLPFVGAHKRPQLFFAIRETLSCENYELFSCLATLPGVTPTAFRNALYVCREITKHNLGALKILVEWPGIDITADDHDLLRTLATVESAWNPTDSDGVYYLLVNYYRDTLETMLRDYVQPRMNKVDYTTLCTRLEATLSNKSDIDI